MKIYDSNLLHILIDAPRKKEEEFVSRDQRQGISGSVGPIFPGQNVMENGLGLGFRLVYLK